MLYNGIEISSANDFLAIKSQLTILNRYSLAKSFHNEIGCEILDLLSQDEINDAESILKDMNQIYVINQSSEIPSNLNFKILGLTQIEEVVKGEIKSISYFKGDTLAVKENLSYTKNNLFIYQTITKKIDWFLIDGRVGFSKEWTEEIPSYKKTDMGRERRGRIIGDVEDYCAENLTQLQAFDLFESLKEQIRLYRDVGYKEPLINSVGTIIKPYLTAIIRNTIQEKLTFNN